MENSINSSANKDNEHGQGQMKQLTTEEIIQAIRQEIIRSGSANIEEFANERGLSKQQTRTLRRILDGTTRNPGVQTVNEILEKLGWETFLARKD